MFLVVILVQVGAGQQQNAASLSAEIDRRTQEILPQVVAWRRDIHEHPELGNREFRTAKLIADHLKALGLEVRSNVGHTGVVGVLRGQLPGPVVALRAEMDALPVVEQNDLPFASKVKTTYAGQEVGVAHVCGHDAHVAMLMGVADVLSAMKDRLPGTVKFIFQPAEEGVPADEEGGAKLMIRDGALDNPRPAAIFALHAMADSTTGTIAYKPNGVMASADSFRIVVKGRATHGAIPWAGVDPIVVASQIVLGIQTIASRQLDVTKSPVVVSVGAIHGGVRNNLIPDEVEMLGTIRAFDPDVQMEAQQRLIKTAASIAESAGATATTTITPSVPVTTNNPALLDRMLPTLKRVVGEQNLILAPLSTVAEDFAFYQQQVPGMYVFLGVTPKGKDLSTVAVNHSPLFMLDEAALPIGVRALANLAVDFLSR